MSSDQDENHPLLPPGTQLSAASRSKLQARRYVPQREGSTSPKSEKAKGKQRAVDQDDDEVESYDREGGPTTAYPPEGKGKGKTPAPHDLGRAVTVIFSNDDKEGNLEVWVDEGESVGHVKEKIRHLRAGVAGLQLRLIYAGRLLTDGILLLPWLRSLEERVRRQAAGVGGGVGDVLREVSVGLGTSDGPASPTKPSSAAPALEHVFLHCNVGGPLVTTPESASDEENAEEPAAPRRRGFDALLDAGLSPEEVAQMRRQFYESRGEEVPDQAGGEINDEHARALEEQWIEGDLTPATATTSTEGMYASILHGLLIGFLFPLISWFFFRDQPLPNFFDAEAEANEHNRREEMVARADEERRVAAHAAAMSSSTAASPSQATHSGTAEGRSPPPRAEEVDAAAADTLASLEPSQTRPGESISARVSSSPLVGAEAVAGVVFSKRTQIGIILGTIINVVFAALRFF